MGKKKKAEAAAPEQPTEAPAAEEPPPPAAAAAGTNARKGKKAAAANPQPAAAAAAPAATSPADAKPSKKRAKDEIDAIFGKGMKKAEAAAAADGSAAAEQEQDPAELKQLAEQVEAARAKAAGKRPKVEGSKDDIFGQSSGKARRRTEEGYAIYREDELGLGSGKGGDTPLCPFDCDCCY